MRENHIQEESLIVMNQGNENKGKLAIVIDDFGYGAEVERMRDRI